MLRSILSVIKATTIKPVLRPLTRVAPILPAKPLFIRPVIRPAIFHKGFSTSSLPLEPIKATIESIKIPAVKEAKNIQLIRDKMWFDSLSEDIVRGTLDPANLNGISNTDLKHLIPTSYQLYKMLWLLPQEAHANLLERIKEIHGCDWKEFIFTNARRMRNSEHPNGTFLHFELKHFNQCLSKEHRNELFSSASFEPALLEITNIYDLFYIASVFKNNKQIVKNLNLTLLGEGLAGAFKDAGFHLRATATIPNSSDLSQMKMNEILLHLENNELVFHIKSSDEIVRYAPTNLKDYLSTKLEQIKTLLNDLKQNPDLTIPPESQDMLWRALRYSDHKKQYNFDAFLSNYNYREFLSTDRLASRQPIIKIATSVQG